MQLSRWEVERQAYKQTGQADWTDRLPHSLARSVTCHGNIQSAAESGGGRETAACTTQHCLKRYLLDGGGGRTRVLQSAKDLQSHRPPSRPTGQASRRPGGQAMAHNAGGRSWSVNWGEGFHLTILRKASNRSALTAVSARLPISIIDNKDTRTRICFDNRFFDYRLTCLIVILMRCILCELFCMIADLYSVWLCVLCGV